MTETHAYHWDDEKGRRGNVREAVGVFQSEKDIQEAIDDFESSGFNHASFSRPASPEKIEDALHHPIHDIQELEDDPAIPRDTFTDPGSFSTMKALIILLPAYILALAAIAYGAATRWDTIDGIISFILLGLIGVGGGAYFSWRVASKHEERIKVEKSLGGLLLWVRTGNKNQDKRAIKIMKAHGATDIHIHGPAVTL